MQTSYQHFRGLRLVFAPNTRSLVLTTDVNRVHQIIQHNRDTYSRFYVVDMSTNRVKHVDENGVETFLTTEQILDDGTVKKSYLSTTTFLSRRLPTIEKCLAVVLFSGAFRRNIPIPSVMPDSTLIVVSPTIEIVPENWLFYFDDVIEVGYVDVDDVVEVLGEEARQYYNLFAGLAYGELKVLKTKMREGWEKLVVEADKMRVKRLKIAGFSQETPNISLDNIALDDYMKDHLKQYIGRPSCLVLVGLPGSGKTYISLAMAGSFKWPTYTISAGDIMNMGVERFAEFTSIMKAGSHSAFIINEFDRLVDARTEYKTAFLTLLEQLNRHRNMLVVGTAVNLRKMVDFDEAKNVTSEILRPGRVDEVIPIPPITQLDVKHKLLTLIAERTDVKVTSAEIYQMCKMLVFMYPSDAISMMNRYKSDGIKGVREMVFNDSERLQMLVNNLDLLRRLGNTSQKLIETIETRVFRAIRWV